MALKQEISGILKHSSIYGISNILSRLPPLILLPIYLNYLTPTDFGKKEIISVVLDFLGIVISMGVANAMSRFYYEYKDIREQNEVVSTIVLSYAVFAGIILAAIATQAGRIAELVTDSASDWYLIVMALASLWMNTIYQMLCDYLRIREKSITFVIISNAKLILTLSLNILFIVHLGYGIYGIFLTTFLTALLFTILISVPLMTKIGMRVSLPKLKEIVSFGAPMVIAQLAGTIVHLSDRIFVKEYISLAGAGIYTLGYRLGNSIHYLVNSPFQQIWDPRRFSIQKDDNAKSIYASVLTYYLFLMVLFGTILAACARDIILIVGQPEYYDAALIAPIITLSYIIFGAQHHFTTGIMIMKKTKYFIYITIPTAVLNLALNFLLIPRYGIMGAALSTLASMVLKLVLVVWLSQRIYPVRWEWKRMLRIVVAGAGAYYVCTFLRYPDIINTWVTDYARYKMDLRLLGVRFLAYRTLVVIGIYLTLVFPLGFLYPQEYAFARKLFGRLKSGFSRQSRKS